MSKLRLCLNTGIIQDPNVCNRFYCVENRGREASSVQLCKNVIWIISSALLDLMSKGCKNTKPFRVEMKSIKSEFIQLGIP